MNISDSNEFGGRLVALAELFDVKLSPTRGALYFEALRDLPFDLVVRALNEAVRTCKFFPRPAELRTLAVGDAEDVTEAAWLAFREAVPRLGYMASVVVDDAALGETLLAMFGSWSAACASEYSAEMWASKRKEFGRVYSAMRHRQLDGSRYLLGYAEARNQGRPDWMKYTTGGRITRGGTVERLDADALESHRERLAIAAHGFSRIEAAGLAKRLLATVEQDV